MDSGNEIMWGGLMILVTGRCTALGGRKLDIFNIQALEDQIATGGSRISVVLVHRSPESTPAEDGELLLLLIVIAGYAGKRPILGDFKLLEITWVCEAAQEVIFGHQLM